MPVIGFNDLEGRRVTFDEIRAGSGNFGDIPRPVLRALSKQYRQPDHYGDPNVISVTTLINPIQQTRLVQRHDLFVDPFDNLWAAYGAISHAFFEEGAGEEDIIEHKLVIERGGVKIGGTFDLLEYQGEEGTTPGMKVYCGKDYKVTSFWSVKTMIAEGITWNGEKSDYFWQAQLYHLMTQDPDVKQVVEQARTLRNGDIEDYVELVPWRHAGKVDLYDWSLVAICRDWGPRMASTIPIPLSTQPIQLIALDRVENYLNQRLIQYKASEMCDDAGLPQCDLKETWGGRRCAKYCDAFPVCHQQHPELA